MWEHRRARPHATDRNAESREWGPNGSSGRGGEQGPCQDGEEWQSLQASQDSDDGFVMVEA